MITFPVRVKTWQTFFNISNNAVGSTETQDLQNVMFGLVGSFLAAPLSPWVCMGSSNSVTAAMDGTNRWVAATNIITGVTNHSWIVLRQTGISANFNVLIQMIPNTNLRINVSFALNAFTGGSISAPPTATNSLSMIANDFWLGGPNSGSHQFRTHVMISSDGACSRAVVCYGGNPIMFWLLDKPGEVVPGWADPHAVYMKSVGALGIASPNLMNLGNFTGGHNISSKNGAQSMPFQPTLKGYGQGASGSTAIPFLFNYANEISGEWPTCHMGLTHNTTAGYRGRHGKLLDVYGVPAALTNGDSMPGDASKLWWVCGDLLLPGDGATTQLFT